MSNAAIVIPKFATQYFSYPHFKTRRLVGSLIKMTRRTINIIISSKLPNRAIAYSPSKKINKQKTQMSKWFHDWCLLGVVNVGRNIEMMQWLVCPQNYAYNQEFTFDDWPITHCLQYPLFMMPNVYKHWRRFF